MPACRRLAALAVVAVAALAAAAPAPAKEDVTATILTPIPADADPGTRVRVTWTLRTTEPRPRPFNASGVYLRVVGTDGTRHDAHVGAGAHEDGVYAATVRVPEGGIRSVAVGLAGTATFADGRSVRSDAVFPLANEAIGAPREGRDRRGPLTALGLAALAALAVAVVRGRRTGGVPAPAE